MYPPKFDYMRAESVDEAIRLLQEHPGAKLLAGGHSLIPLLKLRLADPGALIDIGRIAELNGITSQNGKVRIGALTPHVAVEKSDEAPKALSQAAGWIGDPMVRNRGTVGGNVAHSDPASDLPTVLMALDATFHIAGPSQNGTPLSSKTVAAADFFQGFFMTALAEDELLTAIEIPAETPGTGSAYAKLMNLASRFALVGAAASLTVEGGTCTRTRVAVGSLTPSTIRAPSVEASLTGQALDDGALEAAAAAVLDDLGDDLIGDIHASADYRRQMAPTYVLRALKQAVERAGSA